jgi:hypothetical protein
MADKTRIFIGSSSQFAELATEMARLLTKDDLIGVDWQDYFDNAGTGSTFELLIEALEEHQFGIFFLTADDIRELEDHSESGNRLESIPRANVVFELGLFAGRYGRASVFAVTDNHFTSEPPSDLLGVKLFTYTKDAESASAKVRHVANKIRQLILETQEVGTTPPIQASVSACATHGISWKDAARAGLLQPLEPDDIEPGDEVVQAVSGVGKVFDSFVYDGELYVTVELSNGQRPKVRSRDIFKAEHKKLPKEL